MEIRELKISANASGGTAAAGAKTYRITLPSSWVKKMDLDHADAKAEVVFDGTSIIIRPKAAEDILLFQSQALKAGHEVVRYEYFDQETLCSTILYDFTEKILRVKNHTDQILKTAFGRQERPTWDDFIEFLEERCVPKSRKNINILLKEMGLTEYDQIQIVEKTQGRMAEDAQWLKITRL